MIDVIRSKPSSQEIVVEARGIERAGVEKLCGPSQSTNDYVMI